MTSLPDESLSGGEEARQKEKVWIETIDEETWNVIGIGNGSLEAFFSAINSYGISSRASGEYCDVKKLLEQGALTLMTSLNGSESF